MRPAHFIDAHAHLMTRERTASGIRWIRRAVDDYRRLPEDVPAERLLGDMTGAGADVVYNLFYPLGPGESDTINRWQSELGRAHSPVVVPFASVHPADEDPAGVVRDALFTLDLTGLKLHPYVQRLDLLDRRLDDVYRIAEESGRPLIIHTGFSGFYRARSLTAELLELATRYHNLTIVAAHLCYPDLPLDRWSGLLEEFPHLYLDATNVLSLARPGTADGETLTEVLARWSNRFLFGSDYPMGMAYPVDKLYSLPAAVAPTQEALDDLCWRTAARLVETRRLPASIAADLG